MVEDAHAIYPYARQKAPSKDVFVWGHSMGTGVASRTVAELSDGGRAPDGLVLESPFNNLRDVITHHPFRSVFVHCGPCFRLTMSHVPIGGSLFL